ncbi:hypothetical protein ROHU_001379 [Labeo rohita]|uniref:Uncharacterized protein n=1 Tax=Labeo rohita TaxID=84645 RepID=A0A498P0R2_LABRO|nr:hypothetical protein ROHU_001379 [Labeo rohita]
MRVTIAVLLLLYKCLIFAPNAATEPVSSELSTKDDNFLQNNIKELTSALQIFTDLLQELGAAKKKLQATETRLNALETSQQKLMSRLANSEAQIEKVKMENKGRAKHFVVRNFYVDDGLTSVSTSEEAIALFRNTQKMLAESNLRLHKIPSNSKTVMKAFPKKDHAEDLKDLDLGVDSLPVQHSLGLTWNLETDSFNFHVHQEEKPFMRMGVLSTVNSLYDPLGFLAPVVV